jgi:class 3 adenylate cyclase
VVDFTALGDTVNTASRLASSAASGEILMSEAIYAKVAQLLAQPRSTNVANSG